MTDKYVKVVLFEEWIIQSPMNPDQLLKFKKGTTYYVPAWLADIISKEEKGYCEIKPEEL